MVKKRRQTFDTTPAEKGGLGGNDLVVIDPSGEAHGFMFSADKAFGQPCVHTKVAPTPSLNVGKSSPASSGSAYDVRDADGTKAITHINWTGGAGQKSLDGDNASAYKFLESKNVDIETPGKLSLMREAEYTQKYNITGPFYSALGYLWAGNIAGGASFTTDGTTWYAATGLPAENVTSFTTDGRFVYAAVATGSSSGVYKGTFTAGTPPTTVFAKIDTGSTEKVAAVCFHAGFFFAAQDYVVSSQSSKAALLDANAAYAFSTITTPAQMKNFTTVDLVQAANSVYWVVSQGERSYIYELNFNPDTQAMSTQQYAEFPSGFVATCAVGYLSSVYVGGYWMSETSGVGQGQVYECSSGYSNPLFYIGDRPSDTDHPSHPYNDNRIWAITAGERNLFVNTNRGIYRWDIDNGGYSHVFDLTSSGQGVTEVVWDSGSDYSWDGTDYTVPDPPHHEWPTKWVDSVLNGTPTVTYGSGVATIASGGMIEVSITDITLSNSNGNTVEIKTADGELGGGLYMLFRDDTRAGFFEIQNQRVALHRWTRLGTIQEVTEWIIDIDQSDYPIEVTTWKWVAHDGVYGWSDPYHIAQFDSSYEWPTPPANTDPLGSGYTAELPSLYMDTLVNKAKTVRFSLEGTTATLSTWTTDPSSATTLTTNDTKSDATGELINWSMGGLIIDYLNIASAAAYPPGFEIETLSSAGLAFHNGGLYCPYVVPSYTATKPVTSASKANPCIVTCTGHGLVNSDEAIIVGNSTTGVNGTWTVTKLTDDTFSIPYDNSGGDVGTGGYCYQENKCREGWAKNGEDFAEYGYLVQSETNFNTGTMLKDFRFMDVAHEVLASGAEVTAKIWIDGIPISPTPMQSKNYTRFYINSTGYSIKTMVGLTRGSGKKRTKDTTPTIGAINVMWDFIKVRKHTYMLDIRTGAKGGFWGEDPQEAVEFLWSIADKQATFNDNFSGAYSGMVEEASFYRAPFSTHEGVSGIVKLTVREEL